jgi:hypothetical protein
MRKTCLLQKACLQPAMEYPRVSISRRLSRFLAPAPLRPLVRRKRGDFVFLNWQRNRGQLQDLYQL